jgi:hypothetical protein
LKPFENFTGYESDLAINVGNLRKEKRCYLNNIK